MQRYTMVLRTTTAIKRFNDSMGDGEKLGLQGVHHHAFLSLVGE